MTSEHLTKFYKLDLTEKIEVWTKYSPEDKSQFVTSVEELPKRNPLRENLKKDIRLLVVHSQLDKEEAEAFKNNDKSSKERLLEVLLSLDECISEREKCQDLLKAQMSPAEYLQLKIKISILESQEKTFFYERGQLIRGGVTNAESYQRSAHELAETILNHGGLYKTSKRKDPEKFSEQKREETEVNVRRSVRKAPIHHEKITKYYDFEKEKKDIK